MTQQVKEKTIRRTVLLDDTTVKLLENYGIKKSGSKNINAAIRQMAREIKG